MGVVNYIKETRAEMRHVSWPTRKQVFVFTALVIGISVLTAVFLGFFDVVFPLILERFIV